MPKYTLVYFPFQARGEPTRLAFVIGGIPFTNKCITYSEFPELKPTLPQGQLPILEIEDDSGKKKTLCHSNTILRYVGTLTGLNPSDPADAADADMIVETTEALTYLLSMTVMGAQRLHISDKPWTKEEVLAMRKKVMAENTMNNVTYYLEVLEKHLEANGTGWFVGDKVTIADLRVHHVVTWLASGLLDGIPASTMEKYPLLTSNVEKIEAIPQVAAFRSKYGKKYNTFDYKPKK